MPFHILPTDADFDELHPEYAARRRARKERESHGFGKFCAIIGQLLVLAFCGICIFSEFDRSATIGEGFQRTLNSPLGIMAVLIVPYFLFMWRVELFLRRRLRRIRANVKVWIQDDGREQPMPPAPVRPAPARPRRTPQRFNHDPMRN